MTTDVAKLKCDLKNSKAFAQLYFLNWSKYFPLEAPSACPVVLAFAFKYFLNESLKFFHFIFNASHILSLP